MNSGQENRYRDRRPPQPGALLRIAVVFASLLSLPLSADYQAGLEAFEKGYYKLAMREWKAAVEQPSAHETPNVRAETRYAIAGLYWEGQGTNRDYFQAREWLEKAADMGHAAAMAKLGYLYTDGISVEQDFDKAFGYYSEAARLGDVDGLYNLGIFYLNGWGTGQDATMAKQYLAAASAQGDEAAEQALQHVMTMQEVQTVDDRSISGAALAKSAGGAAVIVPEDAPFFHDESWLMARNPDHYAIQVIGLLDRGKLLELAGGHVDWSPFGVYTVQLSTGLLHVLVQGDYATVEEARAARDRFPRGISPPEDVWVRRFEAIQGVIREEAAR